MNTIKRFFLFNLLLLLHTYNSASNTFKEHLVNSCQKDTPILQLYAKLTPESTQLLANLLHLLDTTSLLEYKIHQLIIPITRLNQEIRSNFDHHKETTKNINTLKTLLERLSYLINARTIYNDTLQTCITHINHVNDKHLVQLVNLIQQQGQIALNAYAESKNQETSEKLIYYANDLNTNVQNIHELANIYQQFEQGAFTKYFKDIKATENIVALASINDLLKNNIIATKNSENILNIIDNSSEYIISIINQTSEIYKHYYSLVYDLINQDNCDKAYALTLFSINDILPSELRSALPHPDKVLEHALTSVKELYTHVELTRQ